MSEKKPEHIPPCLLPLLTRRRLLKNAAVAAAVAPLATACGGLPGEFVSVKDTGEFEPLEFSLEQAEYAALKNVGGLAHAKVENDKGSLEVVLVRSADDEILAFNHKCPHADLGIGPVDGIPEAFVGEWLPQEKAIQCNWHKSVFNKDGTFNEGLSDTTGVPNLPVYSVLFDADKGFVQVKF